MSTPVVHTTQEGFSLSGSQKGLIRWNLYIGFIVLAIAVTNGLGQALQYADINILQYFPGMDTYYQGLTVHGVFNVIVLTFAFANGFVALTTARGLNRPLNHGLLHSAFWTLLLGTILAAAAMFSGEASVLYTFYPPLQAHWAYYLGLALLVVSTWLTSINLFITLRAWKRDNPGRRIPLLAHISVCTYVMWDIASLGIAIEVVGLLLPWSLGLFKNIDPLLSRTLFWFSGHPIVYFWLLPAYVSWYCMVPQQAHGKLHSDTITRLVFLLFIVLSIPVGFHHQFTDPGVGSNMKAVHAVLTFGVFFPSLVTAFSIMAALELGGRRRGGKGLISWFFKLPWGNPALAAQLQAMLVFLLGGITGLINASYNLNQVVHNTTFVPGHFHMTVGTAVALSIMGISYWAIPWLKGRALWGSKLALFQGWAYFVGVLIFARGMISGGLEGMPRRTALMDAPYDKATWDLAGILIGVGGALMFISAVCFLIVMIGTIFAGKPAQNPELPYTVTIKGPSETGWDRHLDKFWHWVVITIILILIAYGPFFLQYLPGRFLSPGYEIF